MIKVILALITIVWLTSSCSPIYYEPSSHNVPLMEQKGDLNIGASANLILNKGEVQASYAITDYVGVITNYMIKKYLTENDISDIRTTQMFEAGVGFFHNPHEKIALEAYALVGRGSFENYITDLRGDSESLAGLMTKYALQLNFGLKEKGLDLAYSIKPTRLNFSNLDGDLIYGSELQKDVLSAKDSYNFIEHAITARFGMDGIKFQAQLGTGGRQIAERERRLRSHYLTCGIYIDIRKLQESGSEKELTKRISQPRGIISSPF